MKFFLLGLGLISVFAVNSFRASCTQPQTFNLVGQWKVELKFAGDENHAIRFDAQSEGKGAFLLLDNISNLNPPAEPTKAQWNQAASDQVTFSGAIEFPIGNVGRDAGVLVFKGRFESANSISGNVSFFRAGQDPNDPGTVPAKTGDFTSKRSTETFNLVGRWKVEFKFAGDENHAIRFDAQSEGKGAFLLLDNISSLNPPAEPTRAQWDQAISDQVTFSGAIEFPIGNVGRDTGTLVFKGHFESTTSISGKVSFFRVGEDPNAPGTIPAKTGDFTAKRATTSSAANVSAASYNGSTLASQAIVAAFGSNLAIDASAAATFPLPTSLAGTTVTVRADSGIERLAPLFFVSPTQVNYLVPAGMISDAASIVISCADGSVATETLRIAEVAPGLFSANANGEGVAAAVAFRVKSDGSQSYEPVAEFDTAQNKIVSLPIDLGPDLGGATDQVFLILFGTGIRGLSAMSSIRATIGGTGSVILFAGAQGWFDGLDQVNLLLPRSLAGRGILDVALVVDGKPANFVQVGIR